MRNLVYTNAKYTLVYTGYSDDIVAVFYNDVYCETMSKNHSEILRLLTSSVINAIPMTWDEYIRHLR
jgi:hypothetical protein